MKAFSRINIGEKISFIIGCKNYLILVVSKKTDKPLCKLCIAQVLKFGAPSIWHITSLLNLILATTNGKRHTKQSSPMSSPPSV